LLESICS